MPFVSPVTVIEAHGAAQLPVMPEGEEVAVYDVIAEPPLLAGAVKVTAACALPPVAVPMVGAPGSVAGVTLLEAADGALVPTALVAVTVNVYAVPLVRPLTVIDVHGAAHVPVIPLGEEVAVYDVIAEPPLLAGAVKFTVACALPAVAMPMVGAPGTVTGVTLLEAAEGALAPTALFAVTVNVYAVPLVSPLTGMEAHGAAHDPVMPEGEEVAVYEVIGAPPSLAGAVKVTVAWALPAVAVPIVGAPGTVAGVTLFDAADAGPVPTAFVAVTVKVYAVPFVSPLTVMEAHGAAHDPVMPEGEEIAVYEVIGDPPSLAGAVNATVACALPRVAMPMVGAPGIVAGVTLLEGAEAGPVPTALVAATVKVYAVPLASPFTVMEAHGAAHDPVMPEGEEVAVYETIGEPPSVAGAVKATLACALPAVAMPIVGAPGGPSGVTLFDGADAALVPTELVAVTVKVYAVPFVRPFTVMEVHGAMQVPAIAPGEEIAV
ncbi:MAG TPA: hypothetical protein VFJ86_14890 [Usitatibacter sp.]|nr:hypothetical protein [Usitatibacter sp.]